MLFTCPHCVHTHYHEHRPYKTVAYTDETQEQINSEEYKRGWNEAIEIIKKMLLDQKYSEYNSFNVNFLKIDLDKLKK